MRRNNSNIYSRGVSIIEALIAAAIVGIGFISIYAMTTTATRMIYAASQRDNDTRSASMIMDDLALDSFTIGDASYNESISSTQYNNLDLTQGCASDFTSAPMKFARQKVRWCNFLQMDKGGMGTAAATDERKILVEDVTITSNGYQQQYKVVSVKITHNSQGRTNQIKWYFKILHEN